MFYLMIYSPKIYSLTLKPPLFKVRVGFYKNGKETAYTVFDAHGVANKNSWFDCSRILYTSYDDLNRLKAVTYCGIPG